MGRRLDDTQINLPSLHASSGDCAALKEAKVDSEVRRLVAVNVTTVNEPPRTFVSVERLLTLSEASDILGIPLFAIRRAARSGAIPTYRIGNGRARVRMSDLLSAVDASKIGGAV